MTELEQRISTALEMAERYGGNDGAHHKMWVIDQMVRALTGCPLVIKRFENGNTFLSLGECEQYAEWVRNANDGEDGPDTYEWETGIAP